MFLRRQTSILMSALLCAVLIAALAGSVTYWTFEFFKPELRGDAFDSLGKSLLEGRADVEQPTINWEGFPIGGKTYIYQGPFPALLRIALNAVAPAHYGTWSRVSVLLASLILFGASYLLGYLTVAERSKAGGSLKAAAFATAVVFATPAFYLLSNPRIYNESIIWGLTWSIVGLSGVMLALYSSRTTLGILVLSVASSCATLARPTFGAPLYLILIILCVAFIRQRKLSLTRSILLLAPAVCGIVAQAWYNEARFGHWWKFIDYSVFYFKPDDFGGDINPRRIVDALYNYFVPRVDNFAWSPLFLRMVTTKLWQPTIFPDWREQVTALTLCSPWLIIAAAFGTLQFRRRSIATWCCVPLLFEAGIILSFHFITQRYAAELIPLLVWLAALSWKRWSPTMSLITLVSIAATISSTLSWHMTYAAPNVDIPQEFQHALRMKFIPRLPTGEIRSSDVSLLTLTPANVAFEFAAPRFNQNWDGGQLLVGGWNIEHGIGIHAAAHLDYVVPEAAHELILTAALSDSAQNCRKASFAVSIKDAKGTTLAESPRLGFSADRPDAEPLASALLQAQVTGLKTVTIDVSDLGTRDCDHAVIAEPRFR